MKPLRSFPFSETMNLPNVGTRETLGYGFRRQGRHVCDVHHEPHPRQYGLYHRAAIHGLRQEGRRLCEQTTDWTEFEVF